MSVEYWLISGVGVDIYDITPHINNRKLIDVILRQCPDNEDIKQWEHRKDIDKFDMEEFMYGSPFQNFADLLTHCDDTDTLTFGEDGDGGIYLYYPPSMPWERTKNEPDSIEEVHRRLINVIQAITDMGENEIRAVIDDDIYVVGCG